MKMKSNTLIRAIGTLLGIGVILTIIALSVATVQRQQDIRNQAAGADKIAFTVEAGSSVIRPGQAIPVDIHLKTTNVSVSGFTLKGIIKGVDREDISVTLVQHDWLTPITNTLKETNEGVEFTITELTKPDSAGIYADSATVQKIASILVKPEKSGPVSVSIYPDPATQVVEYGK